MRRLHKRESIVNSARVDLLQKVIDWQQDHEDLTNGEYIALLNSVFSDLIGTWAKYHIREERHGGSDKAGGIE